jgi:SAM-dependent methyltransferase
VFIGCTPFYGFHLLICIFAAWLLRLNQVKTYLASHISLPGIWPLLLIAELQLGRFLRGSPPLALRVAEIRQLEVRRFFVDLLLGSTVVGLVLGGVFAWVTYRVVQRTRRQPEVEALLERAARPYVEAGMIQWEFVRGKLRHDPLYFGLLQRGSLPADGTLLDLGCGRGILFSLLEAARRQAEHCAFPPGWPEPPSELELLGIEGRAKAARTAGIALRAAAEGVGDPSRPSDPAAALHPCPPADPPRLPLRAEVRHADLRDAELPPADVATLFDVLHYLPAAAQEELLDRVAICLKPGGLLLIREADADGGGAFWRTRAAERLCAILRGDLRQRFHYRSRADWQRLLAERGFRVEAVPMSQGTPYSNVLIEARREVPPNPGV